MLSALEIVPPHKIPHAEHVDLDQSTGDIKLLVGAVGPVYQFDLVAINR
jgi:hypothetical protein